MDGRYEWFIAHANEDAARAGELAGLLRARGIRVFLAAKDLPGGSRWPSQIVRAQQTSAGSLLLVGRDHTRATFFEEEVQRALDMKRRGDHRVLPVYLHGLAKPTDAPYGLASVQGVDASLNWDAVLTTVRGVDEAPDSPTADAWKRAEARERLMSIVRRLNDGEFEELLLRLPFEAATFASKSAPRRHREVEVVRAVVDRRIEAEFTVLVQDIRQIGEESSRRIPAPDPHQRTTERMVVRPGVAESAKPITLEPPAHDDGDVPKRRGGVWFVALLVLLGGTVLFAVEPDLLPTIGRTSESLHARLTGGDSPPTTLPTPATKPEPTPMALRTPPAANSAQPPIAPAHRVTPPRVPPMPLLQPAIHRERRQLTVGSIDVGFVAIGPGKYAIGSPRGEAGRDSNEPRQSGSVDRLYWIQQTEVSQALWEEVLGDNPALHRGAATGDRLALPVERVSWFDATVFADALSETLGLRTCYGGAHKRDCRGDPSGGCPSGDDTCRDDSRCGQPRFFENCDGFRLPTEFQWEVAARAGESKAQYDRLGDIAWTRTNANGRPRARASRDPNRWRLYDVLGNVWEWTHDGWRDQSPARSPLVVGKAWATASERPTRGCGFRSRAHNCRLAERDGNDPHERKDIVGLRLALVPPASM